MARPKTGDKHAAILRGAAQTIAAEGISASTATIAKASGVAEGSLFRYFQDKDDLLNQLYRELKNEMRAAMMSDFPTKAALKTRAHHLWSAYIAWGVQHPDKRKAMAQLSVSERITKESREQGQIGFAEASATIQQMVKQGRLAELSPRFASDLLLAMAETTMTAMAANPKHAERYGLGGFEAFWAAVAKK